MEKEPLLFVLGSVGVGKTSILSQFIYSYFPNHYDCGNEDSYLKYISVNGMNIRFQIFESEIEVFEGLKYLNCLRTEKSDGFIFVFSLISQITLTDLNEIWCPRVYKIKQIGNKEHVPMIFVGNKSELNQKRNISMREIQKIMKKFDLIYIECSAKTNLSINNVFEIIAKDIIVTNKIIIGKPKRCIMV